MIVVASEDVAPQRWKNGGGSLRELLLRPLGPAWSVRIAIAAIDADGPFSHFPGVTRCFAVIEGGGVELTLGTAPDVQVMRTRAGAPPLRFDGGTATGCRLLDGAATALNLMLRGADGRIELAAAGVAWSPAAAACGLYAAVAGFCSGVAVPAASLVWFDDSPPTLRFDPHPMQPTPTDRPPGWWIAANPAGSRR